MSSASPHIAAADVVAKVWSLETYELLASIAAHRGSILCLFLSADGKLLLSSGGDAIVNVGALQYLHVAWTDIGQIWSPSTLKRLFSIYSKYDVGDVFCVVYSVKLQTVYLGAQNTSIQVLVLALAFRGGSSNPSVVVRSLQEATEAASGLTPLPATRSLL